MTEQPPTDQPPENTTPYVSVDDFVSKVIVHELQDQNRVVLVQDFEYLAQIARGLEDNAHGLIEALGAKHDERFYHTKRFALEATVKRFTGMKGTNEEITAFYELCVNLLENDWSMVDQPEQPPVGEPDDDTGSILDSLTSGN